MPLTATPRQAKQLEELELSYRFATTSAFQTLPMPDGTVQRRRRENGATIKCELVDLRNGPNDGARPVIHTAWATTKAAALTEALATYPEAQNRVESLQTRKASLESQAKQLEQEIAELEAKESEMKKRLMAEHVQKQHTADKANDEDTDAGKD